MELVRSLISNRLALVLAFSALVSFIYHIAH